MEKGTYWIYAGSVAWQGQDNEVQRRRLTWKAEVLDSLENGRFKVALLLGDPRDLAWYSESTKRGCHLLTVVDNREYYLEDVQSPCALPQSSSPDLARSGELILKLPANKGDSFGGDPERERTVNDGMYAWVVENLALANLRGIRGIPKGQAFTAYDLAYRTMPDHQFITYVPGIGLTSYEYGHHGTVAEVDVRLVEFHRNAPGR